MDIHSNLEYLCRVCAANTKGRNSVAECVYILKTAGLKDKLDKFLYLKVSENDSLPKVLCKSCFRQVEATASLSKIAKHTQQVFRDFLLSNLPKGPSESRSTAEFTSSDFMSSKTTSDNTKRDSVASSPSMVQLAPPPPPVSTPILQPPSVQPSISASRKDDVVVNVSVADPLTRDNQQKMISNSQRRQSLLLDSRFTPKSIAQKQIPTTMAAPRPIAPKLVQSVEALNVINNPKPTAPLINFYPVKPQQQAQLQQAPQVTQITTFSSGGYVIGRINANPSTKEERKKNVKNTPDNILQQKRKNLVKALNNIKANNYGQVSLLKSSQQKQAEALQNVAKTPLTEVVNQATEDELPDRIIIAAPKNKLSSEKSKKEPLNLSSKIPATIAQLPISASSTAAITSNVQQQQQEQINSLNGNPSKPAFPEDITLGRVIRDMDLLKLILKALKWPVNKQNIELQLQRLRNSKFTDIMSDGNLLQDTDLTQLLGPYLAPVLLAAQALQQQQQQILANTATLSNQNTTASLTTTQPQMTALEAAQEEINKSIPYKLPPETSVQLVPATPEETEVTQSPPLPPVSSGTSASVSIKREKRKYSKSTAATQKKQRRSAAQRARDSIVISDEEESLTEGVATKKPRQRANKSFATQFELDPNFITHFNLLSGSGGNEADELMALLLKQKAALLKDQKVQKRRRNSVSNLITLPPSEFDALIDLDDDIVLMEPVSTTSSETGTSTPEQQQPRTDLTNTFVMPSVPLITRPIIKRRKTVIHSLKDRINFTTEIRNKEPLAPSAISLLRAKEKHMEETINQVAIGNITILDNQIQPSTNKTLMPEKSVVIAPVELPPAVKAPQQKKTQNKSSLGKQLLEAIGLQQLPPKIVSNIQNETPSSSTVSTDTTVLPKSKQSIQQIRSALKKSLKQAQEQQQKKIELSSSASNTIIQDADSTTKPAVKEILVVEGKANKSDIGSSEVDVEEQIDKVTLMVRQNDEETGDRSPEKRSEKEEKNEFKKSHSKRIQDRRCTITNRNTIEKEKSNEVLERSEKTLAEIKTTEETEKMAKEASSLALNEGPGPNSLEIVAPKRRGRKRLVDKQAELEAAEAKEKENDDTPLSLLIEKSQPVEKLTEEESEMANSNKNEEESESNKTPGRPTRQSKTQSRYYKGPDKPAQSKRLLPSRTTRNRKYC